MQLLKLPVGPMRRKGKEEKAELPDARISSSSDSDGEGGAMPIDVRAMQTSSRGSRRVGYSYDLKIEEAEKASIIEQMKADRELASRGRARAAAQEETAFVSKKIAEEAGVSVSELLSLFAPG
jgi:hypothetical protein